MGLNLSKYQEQEVSIFCGKRRLDPKWPFVIEYLSTLSLTNLVTETAVLGNKQRNANDTLLSWKFLVNLMIWELDYCQLHGLLLPGSLLKTGGTRFSGWEIAAVHSPWATRNPYMHPRLTYCKLETIPKLVTWEVTSVWSSSLLFTGVH